MKPTSKRPTRKNLMRSAVAAIGLALGMGFLPMAQADEGDAGGQPGRAVRLSSVDGQVQLIQGGQTLADQAIANTPLFEGTQLNTGNDGRAEVQFEDGSVVRIPPASSLTLSVLQPNGDTELELSSGMGYFELQDGGQSSSPLRVRFGSVVVTAGGFTVLRVKLDDGPPNVAVFSGNAHLENPSGLSVDLHGGESVALNVGDPANSSVAESIEPDSWDSWNADRDQALTASETASTDADKNLPQSNNPAWGDLNANGSWYNVPDQGYVWSPYEASNSGWDPYGTGNWMWTPGYGYVWVSGEPWGYMPYQCGAWNYYDSFGWGWAPGSCQTWWGGGGGGIGGGGGWYFTVGNTPRWYRLPVRPGPPRPRSPILSHGAHPVPFIPVKRESPQNPGRPLPPRARGTPVMIGGAVAAPLRPVETRPVYGREPQQGWRSINRDPVSRDPGSNNRESGRDPNREPGSNGMQPGRPRPPQTGPERGNWPTARPADPVRPEPMRPQSPRFEPQRPEPARPAPPPPARAPQPSGGGSRPSFGGGGGGGGRSAPPPAAPSHPSPPPATGKPK